MTQLSTAKRKLQYIVIILLIVFTTTMIIKSKAPQTEEKSTPTDTPDFIIEHATYIRMNKQGQPKLQLNVNSAIHYGQNGRSHMVKPQISSLLPGETWYAESEYGKTYQLHGQNKIILKDNVVVKKIDNENTQSPPTLTTSELTVWPDKMIAETIHPVTIYQAPHMLSATGMYADLRLKQVEFHSEVKGHYEKTNQK